MNNNKTIEFITSDLPWYLAFTKIRLEHIAEEQLSRQGYLSYLPLMKVFKNPRHRYAQKQMTQFEPMFPRYIFFQPSHEEQSIAPVRSTIGIANIVRFGDEIAALTGKRLQEIYELEQKQHMGSFEEISPLQVGKRVMIAGGSFVGLEGVISKTSEKRIAVLMQLLGRETEVKFAPVQLKLVG